MTVACPVGRAGVCAHGCSGRRVVCCWAGLLVVPVGGGPPASRPRRELRSARRLEARPGPATRGHRSLALHPSGALHTSGAWCAGVWFGASPRSPAWPRSCLSNFARNSPAIISNNEFVSLGFQRFCGLLKLRGIELRATFLGVVTAVTRCALWRPSHWCGLLCCCVCYSRIQLVFGTKFALRGLLVVTAVESSPCVGKTCQIGPFWASRASFVPHMRCEGVCRASFIPEVGSCDSCRASFVPQWPGMVLVGRVLSRRGAVRVSRCRASAAHGHRGHIRGCCSRAHQVGLALVAPDAVGVLQH